MAKRKYIKKNQEYWTSLGKKNKIEESFFHTKEIEPEIVGSPFYVSSASSYSRNQSYSNKSSSSRSPRSLSSIGQEYSNFDNLSLPFEYEKNTARASVKEPIELCQKAYFHIPIFRNTIDLLSELSESDLILTGGTKASREFVRKWMDSIKIDNIKSQFFREYYRSGNIFLYRLFGNFSQEEIDSMKTIYAKNFELIPQESGFPKNSIPMRYIFLNPMDIVNYESIGTTKVFKKILTKFEAVKLKNPQTEEEKKIIERLKRENTSFEMSHLDSNEVYIDLEPNRLIYVFYKKQDYEPFAIPFGYGVLKDINWKLELKKIDQSISRSLENIILLITMGAEPDKGGINPKNLEAMKQLFSNDSIGRVLVADYTTKADFVIPKLDNILTKQKYEIVNSDIKEGLQNIFFEEAKYSNSEIKIKIFFEKLKEGKNLFVSEFLQPEIKKICSQIGFRDFPKVKFKSSNILDEKEIQKAAMRLLELGILTPKQGIESIQSKNIVEDDDFNYSQEDYIEERKKGLYSPLVGGPPLYESEEISKSPIQVPRGQRGRPQKNSIANEQVSIRSISETARKISELESFAMDMAKNKIENITDENKKMLTQLTQSVVESTELSDWKKTIKQCFSSFKNIDKLNIKPEILEISEEFNVDSYQAALIYHSKKL